MWACCVMQYWQYRYFKQKIPLQLYVATGFQSRNFWLFQGQGGKLKYGRVDFVSASHLAE